MKVLRAQVILSMTADWNVDAPIKLMVVLLPV